MNRLDIVAGPQADEYDDVIERDGSGGVDERRCRRYEVDEEAGRRRHLVRTDSDTDDGETGWVRPTSRTFEAELVRDQRSIEGVARSQSEALGGRLRHH